MANPNIVNVSDIRGKTAVQDITTSATAIVTNDVASNKVFKINSLTIANIDGVNSADVSVDIFRGGTARRIAFTIAVPADSTLVVISKDTSIYLEEGDSLRCTASVNSRLEAVCSYEEIS
jgi:hypothetical protein